MAKRVDVLLANKGSGILHIVPGAVMSQSGPVVIDLQHKETGLNRSKNKS